MDNKLKVVIDRDLLKIILSNPEMISEYTDLLEDLTDLIILLKNGLKVTIESEE